MVQPWREGVIEQNLASVNGGGINARQQERTSMINNVNIYRLHSSAYVRGDGTLTGSDIYKQQDIFGHVESRSNTDYISPLFKSDIRIDIGEKISYRSFSVGLDGVGHLAQ